MTDSLLDILTIEQTAYVLDQHRRLHGPWPININFTTPDGERDTFRRISLPFGRMVLFTKQDGKRDTFKCCLYRQLHAISSTDDGHELFSPPQLTDLAADFAEEAAIQEAWERHENKDIGQGYDDFCSTDLDPEM